MLAAREIAAARGSRATVGRLQPIPGGTNVIASAVDLWLDARDDTAERVQRHRGRDRGRRAPAGRRARAARSRSPRSRLSGRVDFPAPLRDELAALLGDVPQVPTGAGHDAGVLAEHVPSGMIFVRNPTGISHAPEEHAEPDDCAAGVRALTAVLRRLAGP